jgi:hypothetical protein
MLSGWEKNHKMDLAETTQKTSRRLDAIQKWLGFSDAILDQWKLLAGQFLEWLKKGAERKKITRADVADEYPILWSKFLEETNNDDDFMRKIVDKNGEEDVWKQLNEMKISENKNKSGRARKTKQPSDLENEEDIDLSLQDPEENKDDEEEN